MARFQHTLDESVFQELVSRYLNGAFAASSAILRERTRAEDAVQEAFVRVIQARGQYKPSRPFAPWFYAIVRNVCRDIQRELERQPRAASDYVRAGGEPVSPGMTCTELLEGLSESEQEVLMLRIVEDMPFFNIAMVLDCSVEAAKKRYQRALDELRRRRGARQEKS